MGGRTLLEAVSHWGLFHHCTSKGEKASWELHIQCLRAEFYYPHFSAEETESQKGLRSGPSNQDLAAVGGSRDTGVGELVKGDSNPSV